MGGVFCLGLCLRMTTSSHTHTLWTQFKDGRVFIGLGTSVTWDYGASLGGAAGASPLSAASLHPRGPWVCPAPSVPSGVLSPLLTLLQSRETLNKAICVCQHSLPVSAGAGGQGALLRSNRETKLGMVMCALIPVFRRQKQVDSISVTSRSAWSIYQVPGHPGLCRKNLSLKNRGEPVDMLWTVHQRLLNLAQRFWL